jgi:hypothetical protein
MKILRTIQKERMKGKKTQKLIWNTLKRMKEKCNKCKQTISGLKLFWKNQQ